MRKQMLLMVSIGLLFACDEVPSVEDFMKDWRLRDEMAEMCRGKALPGGTFDPKSKHYAICSHVLTAISRCWRESCDVAVPIASSHDPWGGIVDKKGHAIYTKQPKMDKLP